MSNQTTKTRKKKFSDDPLGATMSLGDHLEELRKRLILAIAGLIIASIICLFFGKHIIEFIELPFKQAIGPDAELTIMAPAEGFTGYMKITLIAGVVLSSVWIFYQIWMFIAAGLYPHERRYVYLAVPFSAGLFVTGALFFIFFVAPYAMKFFSIFDKKFGFKDIWTFQNYVSFITMMMLIFGLAFQTPIAIFCLNKTGLVSIRALCDARRYVILAIVIISAIVTPTSDVFNLMALAIPLYLLYEFGILISYIAGRKKQAKTLS